MDWLAQNWIWALVGIAFVAMHLFGHGGHGGHRGHSDHDSDHSSRRDTDDAQGAGAAGVRSAVPPIDSNLDRH